MATVFKINANGTEYDIVPKIIDKSTQIASDATTEDAEIIFQCASAATEAVANLVKAVISLNTKGNLSLESLNKHLNLESALSVQIKPASGKIIVDSGKKLKNEVFDSEEIAFREGMSASDIADANVMRIEFNFDDISDYNDLTGATKPTFKDGQHSKKEGSDGFWSKTNLAGRAFDIRCHNHGGIALQTAGQDSSGLENKIKFESSRAKAITETANFPADYMYEGGKGMEFGTFNNLHSSLFTGDYRFNKDGMVYAVTRQTPVMDGDKFDYPTQADDFKDVVNQSLGVTWEDIVKGILYLKSQNLI